jgi:hypothetical protein
MTWLDDLYSAGDHATRLKHDLEYFSQYLRIRPKVGSLAPFKLNAAQRELHRRIEEQRAKTGRVRVIVLNRDSPDEPQTVANIRAIPALRQDRRAARAAAVTLGRPNGCRAADPAIFRDI